MAFGRLKQLLMSEKVDLYLQRLDTRKNDRDRDGSPTIKDERYESKSRCALDDC